MLFYYVFRVFWRITFFKNDNILYTATSKEIKLKIASFNCIFMNNATKTV